MDVDAQATDIETNIIPYFIGVRNIANSTSNFGYQPGVYGTRNVCTSVNRITGTSGSFVSNMSTGYSGNLGFSQPMDWTFDQFFEPKGGWGEGNGKLEPEFSTGIDDILGMGVGSHIAQTAEEYTAGIDVGSVAIESAFSMKEASLSVVFNILEEESEGIKSTASIKITVKFHNEFYDNAMVDSVLSLLNKNEVYIEKIFAVSAIIIVGGLIVLSIPAETIAGIITATVSVFISIMISVAGWI